MTLDYHTGKAGWPGLAVRAVCSPERRAQQAAGSPEAAEQLAAAAAGQLRMFTGQAWPESCDSATTAAVLTTAGACSSRW